VSYSARTAGNGIIQSLYAECIILDASNAMDLTKSSITKTWHSIARQTSRPTPLD